MFRKATKQQVNLRGAIFGPSGSGKTFSCLRIATGLGGKVAVIDTERGSASRYADRFTFDVCDLHDRSIDGYCEAINDAAAAGYRVLIIDSLSHAWEELRQEVEKIARAKYRGNTWSAWSDGTPMQMQFIDALLNFPGHVLATMRSRTEWTQETTDNGKTRPVRVGTGPIQGKGIEYEFDFLVELSAEHVATIIKDRTGKFQDQTIDKPGENFGKALAEWLKDGSPDPATTPASDEALATIDVLIDATDTDRVKLLSHFGVESLRSMTAAQADQCLTLLERKKAKGEGVKS